LCWIEKVWRGSPLLPLSSQKITPEQKTITLPLPPPLKTPPSPINQRHRPMCSRFITTTSTIPPFGLASLPPLVVVIVVVIVKHHACVHHRGRWAEGGGEAAFCPFRRDTPPLHIVSNGVYARFVFMHVGVSGVLFFCQFAFKTNFSQKNGDVRHGLCRCPWQYSACSSVMRPLKKL
jgi:hypothetical protein